MSRLGEQGEWIVERKFEMACEKCAEYSGLWFKEVVELAVNEDRHSILHRCLHCGSLWEEQPESRRIVALDVDEARELDPGSI